MPSLSFNIDVVGEKQLMTALAEIEPRTRAKLLRRVLLEIAEKVLDRAKARIRNVTGRLARGLRIIKWVGGRKGFGYIVRTGTRAEMGLKTEAEEPYYYPTSVEYGHEAGHRQRGTEHLQFVRKGQTIQVGKRLVRKRREEVDYAAKLLGAPSGLDTGGWSLKRIRRKAGQDSVRRRVAVPEKPYLRPALLNYGSEYLGMLRAGFKRAVEEAARELAAKSSLNVREAEAVAASTAPESALERATWEASQLPAFAGAGDQYTS